MQIFLRLFNSVNVFCLTSVLVKFFCFCSEYANIQGDLSCLYSALKIKSIHSFRNELCFKVKIWKICNFHFSVVGLYRSWKCINKVVLVCTILVKLTPIWNRHNNYDVSSPRNFRRLNMITLIPSVKRRLHIKLCNYWGLVPSCIIFVYFPL